jgi:hypothetical protein
VTSFDEELSLSKKYRCYKFAKIHDKFLITEIYDAETSSMTEDRSNILIVHQKLLKNRDFVVDLENILEEAEMIEQGKAN